MTPVALLVKERLPYVAFCAITFGIVAFMIVFEKNVRSARIATNEMIALTTQLLFFLLSAILYISSQSLT